MCTQAERFYPDRAPGGDRDYRVTGEQWKHPELSKKAINRLYADGHVQFVGDAGTYP